MNQQENFDILIVGGGAAGITVASRLKKMVPGGRKSTTMAIVEPSSTHYYQPLWTLVGAGVYPRQETERKEIDLIPKGATWIQDSVTDFCPDQNYIRTKAGRLIGYRFLVVATGIKIDWNKTPGLAESVGTNGVCSNYSYDTVESTWQNIRDFSGGTAIFTQPLPPIKCGGAPPEVQGPSEI
jgi:sulfide:quinone oxidoreductase